MRIIAMRLICPHCSTEYDVPDAALAAGGRRLRCDRCGHQWRQEGPGAAPPDVAPEPAPAEPEIFVAPEVVKPDRVISENLPKFLAKRDPRGDLGEDREEREPTERRRSIGVESQPRRPARLRGPILLLLAVIVIAAAVFVYRSF
jgi:predicted Zn finger-like uncharacterized protein